MTETARNDTNTHTQTQTQAKPARIDWIDSMRGMSILLVIVYHAYGLTYNAAGLTNPVINTFNNSLDQFRMPAMMFLSGLFVPTSLAKGHKAFLVGKVRMIAYPYFLWSGFMLIMIMVASVTVGRSFGISIVGEVFYQPIEHMWFMGYLFLYFMAAWATAKLDPFIPAGAFLVLSFLPVPGEWSVFWYLASFFMLGVAAVRHDNAWGALTQNLWVSCVLTVAPLVVFVLLAVNDGHTQQKSELVLLAAACVAGCCGLSMRFGHKRLLRPLRYVGRHSIVFYLVHWPAAVLLAEVWGRYGQVNQLFLFAVVCIGAGVLSWIASLAYRRYSVVHAMFVLPGRR